MSVTNQGYSTFSADAVTYIAQKTLMIAKKAVIFQQLGDKAELPSNNSKTFQYTRYDRLALPASSLTEGTTPDNSLMAISTVSAVADQWGAYVNLTDVAVLTIKHPIMVKAIDLMGYQAAETVDREVIKVLLNGTNVAFPLALTARSGLSSTSTDIMSTNLVRKLVSGLRNYGAIEYDGQDFVGVVDPSVEMDLSADTTFQTAASYSNLKVLLNGEIGKWMGVRWMRSNFIPTITGLAAATAAAVTSGGSLADATYFTAVEKVDNTTGFVVGITQQASTALSGGSGAGKINVTVPSTAGYTYNVYIGTTTGVLYQSASLQAPSTVVGCLTLPSSVLLQGIPATGKVVHFSWVFGKESYTVVDLQKLQTYVTPNQASDSDPLAQRRKAGWKLMFKSVINNEQFLVRAEVLSAY